MFVLYDLSPPATYWKITEQSKTGGSPRILATNIPAHNNQPSPQSWRSRWHKLAIWRWQSWYSHKGNPSR